MKVFLIIPTLNEIDGMRAIMPRMKKEWVDEIVFIDGHSTDGTIEYIKEHGYTLIMEGDKWLRETMINFINERTQEGDVIITFSPDGNCVPELIPNLVGKIKSGYDMVIVSRYADGAKSYDDNPITSFGNWLFTSLVNLFYRASYTDVMGIYRAYKKEIIHKLDLDKQSSYLTAEKIFCTKISLEILLCIRAAKRRLKVADIPGDEPARIGGKAKLQVFRWGGAYLFQVFREILFWR